MRAGPLRDGRLLQQPRGDRPGRRRRRLAAHRRPGPRRADGNYRIVGRSKELIIRGGENIYPPEVEEFLHHHPAVAEVAVAGVPDAKYGEVVAAWVVPKAGAVRDARRAEALLSGADRLFQGPALCHDRGELPRTVTGKIRKHVLKENAIGELGLGEAAQVETA